MGVGDWEVGHANSSKNLLGGIEELGQCGFEKPGPPGWRECFLDDAYFFSRNATRILAGIF